MARYSRTDRLVVARPIPCREKILLLSYVESSRYRSTIFSIPSTLTLQGST
ncbi:hypothetical protein JG687_00015110, partial [Phytophthora cactorum]